MGPVIFFFVEEKLYSSHDPYHTGKWVSIDKWSKSAWAALYPQSELAPAWEVQRQDMLVTNHNPDLAAILANQGNSVNMPYVCEPRGLPEDVTLEIRLQLRHSDAQVATWFTAKELLAFDWDQAFKCEMIIDGKKVVELIHYGEIGGEFISVIQRLVGSKNPENLRVIMAFEHN